jgi:hypothetical protein
MCTCCIPSQLPGLLSQRQHRFFSPSPSPAPSSFLTLTSSAILLLTPHLPQPRPLFVPQSQSPQSQPQPPLTAAAAAAAAAGSSWIILEVDTNAPRAIVSPLKSHFRPWVCTQCAGPARARSPQ